MASSHSEESLSARQPVEPLPPEALRTRCTLDHLKFTTTDDLEDGTEFIDQERPIAAIELGVSIGREGYNIFALGPSGTGKYTVVRHFVEERAAGEAPPDDWCYVNDFAQPSAPRALRLPAGKGKELQADMKRLVRELRSGLSSAFESDEFATRRRALEEEFEGRSKTSLEELQEQAQQRGLTLMSSPEGLGVVPLKDGQGHAA